MHTVVKGDITVAVLIAKFLRLGYVVLEPRSENSRYDLVIDRGRGFERVQCKTGRLRSGCVEFNTCSSYAHHGKAAQSKSYRGQIELFGVYCWDNDRAYLVPVDRVGKSDGRLRIDPPKNNQKHGVSYAAEFALL